MAFSAVAIIGVAVYRLARLVVEDEVTRPWRDRVIRWAWRRSPEFEPDVDDDPVTYTLDADNPPRLAYLLSCPWCASVWCAYVLIAAHETVPDQARPVILGLAVAGVAGIVHTLVAAAENR